MLLRERDNPTEELLARVQGAQTEKMQYAAVLSEIAKYLLPAAQDIVAVIPTNKGQIRTVHTYTAVPALAAARMGAGVYAYLMPVGQQWFVVKASEDAQNDMPDVKRWLSDFGVKVHQSLWDSNYQREMFSCIRNLCIFGTACISVMWDEGLVFENYHLRDIAFEVNHRGEIDTVFRTKFMNVRQAEGQFGEGVDLGPTANAERTKNPYSLKSFEFVHCVYPNSKHNRFKIGSFPFVSIWLNKGDKKIVHRGGYYEQPYIVVRFMTIPGETYGRCPSHALLPEIKMYDRMRRIFIESSERAHNPPWWMSSESCIGQPITSPGAIIYGSPLSEPPKPLITGVNPQLNAEILAQQAEIIERGFFNDLFDVLAHYRNMTATEVEARMEEKMVLLSPAINGQKGELTDPVIERSAKLLIRHGMLDPKPQGLKTEIIYTGRLAMAMSTMQSNALGSVMAKWAPYIEVHPVYDNLDMDRAFRHDARAHGVAEKLMKPMKQVLSERDDRKMMEMAPAGAEIMEKGSTAIKNLSDAGQLENLMGVLQ
jgi:hypothetical protein